MLGTVNHELKFSDYNPQWCQAFLDAKVQLTTLFSNQAQAIEHVGSTSLGIAAKPMIDIAVALDSLSVFNLLDLKAFAEQGIYKLKANMPGEITMAQFADNPPTVKTHIIHVVEPSSERWAELVTFRDALLADSTLLLEYSKLKQRLKNEFSDDISGYTEGKKCFIDSVLSSVKG